jgi:hypothetical protein
MARQMPIKGTERPRVKEIDEIAERLRLITEEFDAVKLKKESATDSLIAAMKDRGMSEYVDEDAVPPIRITLSAGPDKVNLKEIHRRKEETDESTPPAARGAAKVRAELERQADALLATNKSGDLVKPELSGAPSRHKKAKTRTAKEAGATGG